MLGSRELDCYLLGACTMVLLLHTSFLTVFPAVSASGCHWSQGTCSPAAEQHGRSEQSRTRARNRASTGQKEVLCRDLLITKGIVSKQGKAIAWDSACMCNRR